MVAASNMQATVAREASMNILTDKYESGNQWLAATLITNSAKRIALLERSDM